MATVVETDTPGNSCSSSCPTTADTGRDFCQGDVSSEDKPNDKDFDTCQPVLTKRQLKKLKKQERWLKIKPDKRAKDRQKKKQYRQQARQQNIDLGPSRKSLKRNTMGHSACRIRVAVDCSFDDLMTERCVSQLVQQLQHCYSANRRAANPLQFYVTGLDGKTQQRMNDLGDYRGWDVHFRTPNYFEEFDKVNVVYLTSESPNVLSTLEESKVYIIGGLVDHNHQKGLCHRLACEKSISHAQLPISKYLQMQTRKVLTINHVFEILLRFTETSSWEKAFDLVIPKRKGVLLKSDIDALDDKGITPVDDRTLRYADVDRSKADDANVSSSVTDEGNVSCQNGTNQTSDNDDEEHSVASKNVDDTSEQVSSTNTLKSTK
ncbi:tRNA (guanine(9)-N1)-methyltransferase [Lamellibrachia satsuma]|nr:tRNA (guanine(9)-N1)-methyltransferase [Lamellibrachia satsuma]